MSRGILVVLQIRDVIVLHCGQCHSPSHKGCYSPTLWPMYAPSDKDWYRPTVWLLS